MIEAHALQKSFSGGHAGAARAPGQEGSGKTFLAVKSVSFSCPGGQVLGLIGPNGAGKTTTLRMLSTAIAPSGGEVRIGGVPMLAQQTELRRKVGFLSGNTGLYGRLTARENIAYFGRAYGMRGAQLAATIERLIAQFQIGEFADKLVDKLSFGTRQRIAIARAVVHSPEILILDEPTTGLDIIGAKLVGDFITDYRARGAAIIFSTHHMHEIEALCDSICIINAGRSVYQGTVAALLETTAERSLAAAYQSMISMQRN